MIIHACLVNGWEGNVFNSVGEGENIKAASVNKQHGKKLHIQFGLETDLNFLTKGVISSGTHWPPIGLSF